MKELLVQLSSFNLWANQLLFHVIEQLPEEKQKQEVNSSFNSVYKTALHMWSAESIWWQRMKLQERISIPMETFTGDMKELSSHLLQQNKMWNEWILAANEHQLEHVFQYQNSKREQFKQPIYQMLIHVFNHATYHRGQLVTILRQLGIEKIPPTDFIVWSRKEYRISNKEYRMSK
jgi:uncharacterized damage-inducible protein DinB